MKHLLVLLPYLCAGNPQLWSAYPGIRQDDEPIPEPFWSYSLADTPEKAAIMTAGKFEDEMGDPAAPPVLEPLGVGLGHVDEATCGRPKNVEMVLVTDPQDPRYGRLVCTWEPPVACGGSGPGCYGVFVKSSSVKWGSKYYDKTDPEYAQMEAGELPGSMPSMNGSGYYYRNLYVDGPPGQSYCPTDKDNRYFCVEEYHGKYAFTLPEQRFNFNFGGRYRHDDESSLAGGNGSDFNYYASDLPFIYNQSGDWNQSLDPAPPSAMEVMDCWVMANAAREGSWPPPGTVPTFPPDTKDITCGHYRYPTINEQKARWGREGYMSLGHEDTQWSHWSPDFPEPGTLQIQEHGAIPKLSWEQKTVPMYSPGRRGAWNRLVMDLHVDEERFDPDFYDSVGPDSILMDLMAEPGFWAETKKEIEGAEGGELDDATLTRLAGKIQAAIDAERHEADQDAQERAKKRSSEFSKKLDRFRKENAEHPGGMHGETVDGEEVNQGPNVAADAKLKQKLINQHEADERHALNDYVTAAPHDPRQVAVDQAPPEVFTVPVDSPAPATMPMEYFLTEDAQGRQDRRRLKDYGMNLETRIAYDEWFSERVDERWGDMLPDGGIVWSTPWGAIDAGDRTHWFRYMENDTRSVVAQEGSPNEIYNDPFPDVTQPVEFKKGKVYTMLADAAWPPNLYADPNATVSPGNVDKLIEEDFGGNERVTGFQRADKGPFFDPPIVDFTYLPTRNEWDVVTEVGGTAVGTVWQTVTRPVPENGISTVAGEPIQATYMTRDGKDHWTTQDVVNSPPTPAPMDVTPMALHALDVQQIIDIYNLKKKEKEDTILWFPRPATFYDGAYYGKECDSRWGLCDLQGDGQRTLVQGDSLYRNACDYKQGHISPTAVLLRCPEIP